MTGLVNDRFVSVGMVEGKLCETMGVVGDCVGTVIP